MSSQITLVRPRSSDRDLTNSESDLRAALTYRLLDDLLGAPRRELTGWRAFGQAEQMRRVRADSTLRATRVERDSASRPSLRSPGTRAHTVNELYGDAAWPSNNGRLVPPVRPLAGVRG